MMDGLTYDALIAQEMIIKVSDINPDEDYFILGHKNVRWGQGTHYPIYAVKAGDLLNRSIQDEGIDLPLQPTLNFIGPNVVASDDPINDRTNVTITPGTAAMIAYTANPLDWVLPLPTTVQQALDRMAANIPPITPIP